MMWANDGIRRGPLSAYERALIEAAINRPWTSDLRDALRHAVEQRGIGTSRHDTPDVLADTLAEFDMIPVVIASGEVITDPDRAERLGLTADARRMRERGS